MTDQPEVVQPSLLPPEVVEVTLRIGVVGAADHVQWVVEVRNPTDGTLMAMKAVPHRTIRQLSSTLAEAFTVVTQMTQDHLVPF